VDSFWYNRHFTYKSFCVDFLGPNDDVSNFAFDWIVFATVCPSAFAEDAPKRPVVGDKAPEFSMEGSDGKTYKANDFEGKQAIIIAWFPRAFTGGCTKECKSMKEHGELLRKFDVKYFTASTDEVSKNADFAKSLELDYPILCDPKGANAKLFGVYNAERNAAARVTFVIGKDGKVLSVIDKVNTESHGQELAKLLDELKVEAKKN
jgi:thioredoxin-dependent peroxiredoxin